MEKDWAVHPVLTKYKATRDGKIFNIVTDRELKGCHVGNYVALTLKTTPENDDIKAKRVIQAHRFIYECFNGLIEGNNEIDHIDGNGLNNVLSNLQQLSVVEHQRKTFQANPLTGKKIGKTLSKAVIAINLKTNERTTYSSLTEASANIPNSTITKISMVLRGERKSHQGYRFVWPKEEVLEDEVWACLFDPLYRGIEVSNLGRVKSGKGIIKYGRLHQTYYRISVTKDKIARCRMVHQLICEAFKGPCPDRNKYTVDHIDRNRLNNKASNLRWATRSEQRRNTSSIKAVKGYKDGELIGVWDTVTDAAKATQCCGSNIARVCTKELKIIKGYVFEYA